MIVEKIIKLLFNVEKSLGFKMNRLRKRYKYLNKSDLLKGITLAIFIFLFSGGVSTLFGGASGIVAQNTMTTQTPTEFFVYSFIHIGYGVSLFLIYLGVRRSKIDSAYIGAGFILLFALLLMEWYLISFVKGITI